MLRFSDDPDVAEQQMYAAIYYLTAFGYIDGEFDLGEKEFVKVYIRKLVSARALDAMPDEDPAVRAEVVGKFVAHFHEVFEHIDRDVRDLFTEAVAEGEKVESFVGAKLKLHCFEAFQSFDRDSQDALLGTIDELIQVDGKVHPGEARFRAELAALLRAEPAPPPAARRSVITAVAVEPVEAPPPPRADDHPFFGAFEGEHYSRDPERLKQQADADIELIGRFGAELDAQRLAGAGRLAGKQEVGELHAEAPFLDGHVYVHPAPAGRRFELTVLGDLHGCYSCLKAALLQADFFAKLEAYRLDPQRHPAPKLVLLGDYIDRGRFSYNGVLRAVMQLFLAAPEHVFVLRGNHEYYVEYRGRIYGGVKPAEAIDTLVPHLPRDYFEAYMRLFEALPSLLLFDRMLFVHAGIPRDKDLAERYRDLASLNDADLRFQMMWSDPSSADHIPDELQQQNARFPFGRLQFEAFMNRIGCTMLVRGHEKVDAGFRDVYPDGAIRLLNLFSAGGRENRDLPEDSSYRFVTPMAMTVHLEDGVAKATPWAIDYQRWNSPERNRFFASAPEIEHKTT